MQANVTGTMRTIVVTGERKWGSGLEDCGHLLKDLGQALGEADHPIL